MAHLLKSEPLKLSTAMTIENNGNKKFSPSCLLTISKHLILCEQMF